jgi:hypothetical protein
MPLARIVASNPAAARYTARTLHEAGYDVEIVPPGADPNPSAELVFDVDADKMISMSTESHVPGEREFVLKPLWRKFKAKRKADEDVARAQHARKSWSPAQRDRYEAARVAAPAAPERRAEADGDRAGQRAREAALAAAEQRRVSADLAAVEASRIAEEARKTDEETRRAEHQRVQRLRQEQESARQRAVEEQRAELRRQEQARQLELARKHEYEEQQMIQRKQQEDRQRQEALRRQQEAEAAEAARMMQIAQEREAARQAQAAQEREARMRQEAMLRQAEEQHRDDVIRQRREEDLARRAEAQRLLLEANKRREESIRERGSEPVLAATASVPHNLPTLGQYFVLRFDQWRQARTARQNIAREKVTRIDRSGRSSWRQAWAVTAGVAAACLIGWGIAAYHDSTPQTVQAPPVLAPGQYAPYPVANPQATTTARRTTARPQTRPKPSPVHRADIADDEVVVHHYYPSKTATAQNRAPQRGKKITDLQ